MKCLANSATAERLKERVRKETIRFYAIVFCYVLADKYGFGKFKLHQILKTVTKFYMKSMILRLSERSKKKDEDYVRRRSKNAY